MPLYLFTITKNGLILVKGRDFSFKFFFGTRKCHRMIALHGLVLYGYELVLFNGIISQWSCKENIVWTVSHIFVWVFGVKCHWIGQCLEFKKKSFRSNFTNFTFDVGMWHHIKLSALKCLNKFKETTKQLCRKSSLNCIRKNCVVSLSSIIVDK